MENASGWYAVFTHALKENYAQANLVNQGFKVYFPRFKKIRRHARKVSTVLAPLFPRYLFVSFSLDSDNWHVINNTRGVSYLVQSGNTPVSISEDVIQELRNNDDENGVNQLSSLDLFTRGETVEIRDGVFAGHTAKFERFTDEERAQVLVKFLNRETSVEIPYWQLSKT